MTSPPSSSRAADAAGPPPPPSELEAERNHLLRSTAKLEESVLIIKAAIAGGDPDRELRAALSVDVVLIAKQRARAAAIADELRRLGGAAAAGLEAAAEPRWLTGERREGGRRDGASAGATTPPAPAGDPAAPEAPPGVWL